MTTKRPWFSHRACWTIPLRGCATLLMAVAAWSGATAAADPWNLLVVIGDPSTPPPGLEMTYTAYCYYDTPAPPVPGPDWGPALWLPEYPSWWRRCGEDLPIGQQVEIDVEANPIGIAVVPKSPGAADYYHWARMATGCLTSPVCFNETEIGLEAKWGSVEGRVRLASNNKGLEGVAVAAYSTTGNKLVEATTDENGDYELRKTQPQQWEIDNHWALPTQHWIWSNNGNSGYWQDYHVLAFPIGEAAPSYISTVGQLDTTVFPSRLARRDFVFGLPEGDEHDPDEDGEDEEVPTYAVPPCPPDDQDCREPSCRGKPIRLVTGSVFFHQVDAVINGIGRQLEFKRRYNSRRALHDLAGAFGRGWEHSLEKSITVVVPNHLLRLDAGTGGPRYFQDSDRDGTFEPSIPVTERSSIVASGGGYTREFTFGGAETYNGQGRLTAQTDRIGNVTSLNRDAEGRLTEIVLPGGRALHLDYAGDRVSQLRGPATTLATYGYTPEGLLERVEYASGSGYVFSYDSVGQVLSIEDLTGRVIESHTYANGKALTSEIAEGQERLTFAYAAGSTVVTDAAGGSTAYGITQTAGLKRVYSASTPCAACGQGRAGFWNADARGRLNQREWYDDAGTRQIVTYTYDANDNFSGVSLPGGRTASYTHDSAGRRLTRVAPDGSLTSWTHGLAGPLTVTDPLNRTTTITYSPTGLVSSVANPAGETTSFTHNASGDLTSVTDALQHATSFGYDELGRRTSVTDALNRTTSIAYDSVGNVTRITSHDGTYSEFTYDAGGRRGSLTDAAGRVTRHGYDPYGRLKTVQDAAGASTRYDYDAMSRLAAITDARGRATSFAYDTLGHVTQVTYPDSASESYSYDANGRLTAKTDRRGVLATYHYDAADRLTQVTFSDGTPTKSFAYDLVGRLLTAQNGSDTLTWTYDAAGQVMEETSSRNGTTVAYTYDAAGRRLTVSLDGSLVASYEHDDASRLVSLTSSSGAFTFDYDAAGQRTGLSAPNGVATSYSYDPLGRLTSLQAVHGGITPIAGVTYTYNVTGNRTSRSSPDFSEAYTYDLVDRLAGVERSGTLTGRSHYRYDAVGNRTTTQVDNVVASHVHNELNQLVSSAGGGPLRVRGVLDEPGNVQVNGQPAHMLSGNAFEATVSAVTGTNSFTVTATDASGNVRSHSYDVEIPAQGVTYAYDANGNLVTKTEGPDTWNYEWNAENQLTRITRNGLEYVRFYYDPLGRRVEIEPSVANSLPTRMVYDGEDILRSEGGTTFGRTMTLYIHGPGIDEPLASEDTGYDFRGNPFPGLRRYYHADGLGSIVRVTDAGGATVAEARYDAWGNIENGSVRPHAYTGREWDGGTGLYYYRARYYDPKIGRFISEDPIGFAGGLNFYTYVGNRPTVETDPSGLLGPADAIGAGVGMWIAWAIGNEITRQVTNEADNTPGLTPGNGGSMDAYRHCLIRCRLNSEMGGGYGWAASAAHEARNMWEGQSRAELKWDWWNYDKGARCAARGAGQEGNPSCQDSCMSELTSGNLAGSKGIPQNFPDPRRRR